MTTLTCDTCGKKITTLLDGVGVKCDNGKHFIQLSEPAIALALAKTGLFKKI